VLSPRGQACSRELAARFRTVTIASTNQEVVDQSDVVVVCVLPHQAEEVLGQLAFQETQGVVSAMAGVHLTALQDLVFPAKDIARSIPAPAVATRSSSTPIHPSAEAARDLYDRLGGCLELADEPIFEAVSAASATVEAYFRYLGAIADWLSAHGVAGRDARRYVAATFRDLSQELDTPDVDFSAFARADTTEGGLNEQFAKDLTAKGTFTALSEGLDAVLARLLPN
jgi:pyrroline-5-carboxylate reductase